MAAHKSYAEVGLETEVLHPCQDKDVADNLTAEGFAQMAQEPGIPAQAKKGLELLSQLQEKAFRAQMKSDWEKSAPAAKKQVGGHMVSRPQ